MRTRLLLLAGLLTAGCSSSFSNFQVLDIGAPLASSLLSGSPTFIINNPGGAFQQANLIMVRTYAAGSDMTMTCTHSLNGGTTKATKQGCETASSSDTCTHYTTTWKSATGASQTVPWEVRVWGYAYTQCTIASTGATSDTIAIPNAVLVGQ